MLELVVKCRVFSFAGKCLLQELAFFVVRLRAPRVESFSLKVNITHNRKAGPEVMALSKERMGMLTL